MLFAAIHVHTERLPIRTYTRDDGLARDQVNRIVRDSRGFLWFCTDDGLSRFDGQRFVTYTPADGLSHGNVRDLVETRDGVHWVATADGVSRLNPAGSARAETGPPPASTQRGDGKPTLEPLFSTFHPAEDMSSRSVLVLHQDRSGTVWVGTRAGLFRLEQVSGRVRFHFEDLGMPAVTEDDRLVEAMLDDRHGSLWIATRGSGLYRHWPDGRTDRYTTRHGLPTNRIHALLEDRDGRLWGGTTDGLFQFVAEVDHRRPASVRVYTTSDGLAHNWIHCLFQSVDGTVWVGTEDGLSTFVAGNERRGHSFRSFGNAHGLSDVAISALTEDPAGNLWIGTANGGAMKMARNGFTTFTQADCPIGVDAAFEEMPHVVCFGQHVADLERPARARVQPRTAGVGDRPGDEADIGGVEERVLVESRKVGALAERIARLFGRARRVRPERRDAGCRAQELPSRERHLEPPRIERRASAVKMATQSGPKPLVCQESVSPKRANDVFLGGSVDPVLTRSTI